MEINNHFVNVNVREELAMFEWERTTWTAKKLQACSPFREDSTPSFYVWLENSPTHNASAGQWGDSGGSEYIRGSFVTLLAYLRQESESETEKYLLAKYAPELTGGDYLAAHRSVSDMFARMDTGLNTKKKPLDLSILEKYAFWHPYLGWRGISEQVQRAMRIGYDRDQKMVVIPWFNRRGKLVQIKRRSVTSKFFRYLSAEDGGWPVRELVYGLDVIHRKGIEKAIICEAEIDAMYCMNAGIPAIAIGGSNFSKEKRDLILRSPLRELILAPDNDKAGVKLKRQLIGGLAGSLRLFEVIFPEGVKDMNEMELNALKSVVKNAKQIGLNKIRISA